MPRASREPPVVASDGARGAQPRDVDPVHAPIRLFHLATPAFESIITPPVEAVGELASRVAPSAQRRRYAMDLDLTEEQEIFRNTLREFLSKEIAPIAHQRDREGHFTKEEAVRFFEVFQKNSEEVANQWDRLVDQLNLSYILPDRKMFVAVGERKIILDDQEVLAQTPGREAAAAPAQTATGAAPMTDEQLGQLENILDQFRKEKEELLSSLKSGDINKQELQELVNLLKKTDISQIDRSVMEAGGAPPPSVIATSPQKDRYADVKPDLDVVKQTEEDISLVFEDLNSQDVNTRAKAAAWLAEQEPSKLAEFGLKMITSDMPLRTRRLAAGIIQKAGEEAQKGAEPTQG